MPRQRISSPPRRKRLAAYLEQSAAAADALPELLTLNETLVRLRTAQQEAAEAGDYDRVHDLESRIDDLLQDANQAMFRFGGIVRAMPPAGVDPGAGTPLDVPLLHTSSDVAIEVPTGPADIEATILDVIPCRLAGNNGCDYRVVITFTESNALGATVSRIGVRWIERSGNVWWISRDGEFEDVDLRIEPNGTASFTVGIFADSESDHRRIRGGRVRIRYNGVDDEGNRFRGDMTSRLERNSAAQPV